MQESGAFGDPILSFRHVKAVAGALFFALLILSALQRRYPHVHWLRAFRWPREVSAAQRERQERLANINVGLQLLMLGVVIPAGYFVLTVMMFQDFTPLGIALAAGSSFACLVLGAMAMSRNRRR